MATMNIILNCIILYLDPENVCLDTNIESLAGLEAEILALLGLHMSAILEIQYGGHNVLGGSGSYQKSKARSMSNMWEKSGAFVRNVHIIWFLPDYKRLFVQPRNAVISIWTNLVPVPLERSESQVTERPVLYCWQRGHFCNNGFPG